MTVRMEALAAADVAAARDETKAWLRLDTAQDDGAVQAVCRAALGAAENFCGQRLLRRAGRAVVAADPSWRRVPVGPVAAVRALAVLAADDSETPLAVAATRVAIDADGDAWVRADAAVTAALAAAAGGGPGVPAPGGRGRVAVDVTAGLAADWAGLPDPVRQGVVRLAAHMFAGAEGTAPPAIVPALWRPWRRMRLA